MEINQAFKVLQVLCGTESEKNQPHPVGRKLGKRIFILQRGWVFVGDGYQSGENIEIKNAAVIRVWGTTKGLGELAEKGPIKDKTIIDPCPNVHVHELAVVAMLDCVEEHWK